MSKIFRFFVVIIIGFFGTFAALNYFFGAEQNVPEEPQPSSLPTTNFGFDSPSAVDPAPDSSSRDTTPAPAPENPCVSKWQKCASIDDLFEKYNGIMDARASCKIAADHSAKYGDPKWPGFWSGGAFQRFSTSDDFRKTGLIHLVETEAQFQNGFGAMVHTTVICAYDLKDGSVKDVILQEH